MELLKDSNQQSPIAKDATRKELFDAIAEHLLEQGVRSQRNYLPQLRGGGGHRCPIGLIVGEDYDDRLENRSMGEIADYFEAQGNDRIVSLLTPRVKKNGKEDWRFLMLMDLVQMHDNWRPKYWQMRLRRIAYKFRVTTTVVPKQ